MAAPDINELLRKLPLAKAGHWLKDNAEKVVFWGLVGGLLYTCFLVYQSHSSQDMLVIPQGGSAYQDEFGGNLSLKHPSLRGYKPWTYYENAVSRNPFVNLDEKVDVPRPAEPKIIFMKMLEEGKGQFKRERENLELSVGESLGPWKVVQIQEEQATLETRYEHTLVLEREKGPPKEEIPPLTMPIRRLFQGKQVMEDGRVAAWLATQEEPTMESLVPIGTVVHRPRVEHRGRSIEYEWVLDEVHEDRCVVRLRQDHPDKRDVVWEYQDPEIAITYKGQSEVRGSQFGHFRIRVWERNRRTGRWEIKTKSRYSEAGEAIKDTSFNLDIIKPDHVVVSRGERKYTLRLVLDDRPMDLETEVE